MAKLYINRRYGQVPNDVLNDCSLSLKAKGLFAFLQSKPDKWSFSVERISLQTKDQKDGIRSALKELEMAGLLVRRANRDSGGAWAGYDYCLSDLPLTEKPSTEKPLTENPDTLSKKDNSKKELVRKRDTYGFEDFWVLYPRKVARAAAEKRWMKLKPDPQLRAEILEGLEKYKRSEQWLKDDGRFIPHPTTWLNQERWLDELPEPNVQFATFG